MRLNMRSMAALAGVLGVLPALADETPIDITTDLEGEYFIVEKGGTATHPLLVVKQVAPNRYTYYIKREFDCQTHAVRYLGEGESLDAMAQAEPEAEMTAISEGSISDQLAQLVCSTPEPPAQ